MISFHRRRIALVVRSSENVIASGVKRSEAIPRVELPYHQEIAAVAKKLPRNDAQKVGLESGVQSSEPISSNGGKKIIGEFLFFFRQ